MQTMVFCVALLLLNSVQGFVPTHSFSCPFVSSSECSKTYNGKSSVPVDPPFRRNLSSRQASSVMAPREEVSTFEQRMRNLVIRGNPQNTVKRQKRDVAHGTRPGNVKVVTTLEEYKKHIGGEKDKLIVVRFYATWCKACRAAAPPFYRLANTFTEVQFVEVPVTEKNANLHQGLGIPSLPYSHIYHPDGGLVQELKMTKRHMPALAHSIKSYISGSCELKDGETDSPYELKASKQDESKNAAAHVL
eukprot:scaffold16416_cov52-Attheya_sp.AAC.10